MKTTIVETSNVKEFHAALSRVNGRGASKPASRGRGDPGLGKTTALSRWVAQTGSVYVRAQVGWTTPGSSTPCCGK